MGVAWAPTPDPAWRRAHSPPRRVARKIPPPMAYNFTTVEKKWQRYWLEHRSFRALEPGEAKSRGTSHLTQADLTRSLPCSADAPSGGGAESPTSAAWAARARGRRVAG